MSKLKIFISGQKYFGEQVLRLCIKLGHEVIGVCCDPADKYIGKLAQTFNIPIVPKGSLCYETMPKGADLGITAHSFDYIGRKTRSSPRLGWIGYHPSLLPRHRGRSSIEWAIRMNDPITGGTIFWLDDGIDRGDIERQDWIWIPRGKDAAFIWHELLLPLGLDLFEAALNDICRGKILRAPQPIEFSTFEPSLDNIKDLYRPDLLKLN